jgi:hypothetical protein
MESFVVHAVRPDVEIRITRPMPSLPSELESQIDSLWAAASERVAAGGAGRLFNGRVFSIDTISAERITGHLTEYRRLVAQVEDHRLFEQLGIRSLAACGVLTCAAGVVIGRRPAAAIYQPGMWQLCPAGSVDGGAARPDGTMDYRGQLQTELQEELGIGAEVIGTITPLCLVEHAGSHVSDLGMAVRTTLSADGILAAHSTSGNGEYDPLRIVPIAELADFIQWAGNTLVPPAPVFLRQAGLLER